MSKYILPVLFFILSYLSIPYLPWYGIGILALIASTISSVSSLKTVGTYFIMGFILWYGMAMMNDMKAGSILSSKIAVLFGNIPKQAILIVTGLMGGISSGLGGLLGNSIHSLFSKPLMIKQTGVK